ncbi:Vac7 domain containing protein [Pyrenophora tritici-repentis]|nr:Vac7 domain containing protein [Pyrenophora tritici-repentis]
MPLSPIGQQRRQAAEPTEFTTATYHKLQVLERKRIEHEYLKEAKRRFDAEMALLNLQAQHGEAEMDRDGNYGGPAHSQPTTPPEYSEGNGFPSALSRPNRFSMPPTVNLGMTTPRGSRANSQVTSPPSNVHGSNLPSHSMPGSRRNSDEEQDDFDNDDFTPLSPAARK